MRDNPTPSTINRRSLFAAFAAGAAAAMPSGIARATTDQPDRQLVELALEYHRLVEIEERAWQREDACMLAYRAQEPIPRDAMRQTIRDTTVFRFWIGRKVGTEPEYVVTPDISQNVFYELSEIDRLENAPPPFDMEDFYASRARIKEIKAERDRWLAECKAVEESTGYAAAQEAVKEATAARQEVGRKIAACPATTLAGLRVRAKLIEWICEGDLSGDDACDTLDHKLIWANVRDLAAMTGKAASDA